MTSLITDFQLLEGLYLRDFEAIDRNHLGSEESEGAASGGAGFPAAPRPRPVAARSLWAAFGARVGLW